MMAYGLAALCGILTWCLARELAAAARASPARRGWAVAATAVAGLGGLATLVFTRTELGLFGVYAAFGAACAVWAAQEAALGLGWLSTPSGEAAAVSSTWRGKTRQGNGPIQAEIVQVAAGLAIAAATFGGPNQIGVWTFAVLFATQLGLKANVIAAAQAGGPARGRLRVAALVFPVFVTIATVAAVLLVDRAWGAEDDVAATRATLPATLLMIGIVRHWRLALPLPLPTTGAARPAAAVAPAEAGPGHPALEPGPPPTNVSSRTNVVWLASVRGAAIRQMSAAAPSAHREAPAGVLPDPSEHVRKAP